MKAGFLFESFDEMQKRIPVNFIAEMWANKGSFNSLTLSQKRHLNELGYTEEKVNSFMPLVQKAKTWAWKDCNVAQLVFTAEELAMWKELENICQIIR